MEAKFDALDRKLERMNLDWGRRNGELRTDVVSVRWDVLKLHEYVQDRLLRLDRHLYELTREVAALRRGEPAGAPAAGHGEQREAASG
ncbi:MAG: hypothetical protein OXJ54_00870 [Gemmatimonadetes bacterium]|nr:hypothetical protein [Candidatus Palauibacter rhopaloidicola]